MYTYFLKKYDCVKFGKFLSEKCKVSFFAKYRKHHTIYTDKGTSMFVRFLLRQISVQRGKRESLTLTIKSIVYEMTLILMESPRHVCEIKASSIHLPERESLVRLYCKSSHTPTNSNHLKSNKVVKNDGITDGADTDQTAHTKLCLHSQFVGMPVNLI